MQHVHDLRINLIPSHLGASLLLLLLLLLLLCLFIISTIIIIITLLNFSLYFTFTLLHYRY